MAKEFKLGEKVFAKVRGYPPWPAQVQGVDYSTPNRVKYHVTFYGTYEIAVCKSDDIYPYEENKSKFGKPLKRKGFNEALAQIESGTLHREFVTSLGVNDEDCKNTYGEMANRLGKLSRPKECSYLNHQTVSDEHNSRNHEAHSKSADRLNNSKCSNDTASPTSQKRIQRVSRSGRKIKPKKFADEEIPVSSNSIESNDHSHRNSTSTNQINKSVSSCSLTEDSFSASEEDRDEITESDTSFVSSGARRKVRSISDQGRKDNISFNTGTHNLRPETQIQFLGLPVNQILPGTPTKAVELRGVELESQLLRLDALIKASLCSFHAKLDKCLVYLAELSNLPVDCSTLQKYPQIVDTIKRLSKYVGRANSFCFSETEREDMKEKTFLIRCKSQQLYNKYKLLFTVPDKEMLLPVYSDHISRFHESKESIFSRDQNEGLKPTSRDLKLGQRNKSDSASVSRRGPSRKKKLSLSRENVKLSPIEVVKETEVRTQCTIKNMDSIVIVNSVPSNLGVSEDVENYPPY